MVKARHFTQCVYVCVGDTIILDRRIPHRDHFPEGELSVVHVKRRYGAVNNGTAKRSPLLTLHDLTTGETHHFDNSYVGQVVRRSTVPRGFPTNIYRNRERLINHAEDTVAFKTEQKGAWKGTVTGLIRFILSTMSIEILRPIDSKKACMLYYNQCRGLLSGQDQDGLITVRMKSFRRWVEQNTSRVFVTVAELERHETEIEQVWEDEYWAGVEEDTQREGGSCYDDEDGLPGYPRADFEEDMDIIDAALSRQ